MWTLLLVAQLGLAGSVVQAEIDRLTQERNQIIELVKTFDDTYAETLADYDDAIQAIDAALLLLNRTDDTPAIDLLVAKRAQIQNRRQAVVDRKAGLDIPTLRARVVVLQGEIASLAASLAKIPEE